MKRSYSSVALVAVALLVLGVAMIGAVGTKAKGDSCCPSTAKKQVAAPASGGHNMMHCLQGDVKLTAAQEKKLSAIWGDFHSKTASVRQEMGTKRSELARLLASDNPNRTRVNALVDDMTKLHGRMAKAGVDKLMESGKVLTPAQRKTVAEKMTQCGEIGMMGGCEKMAGGSAGCSGHGK